MNERVAKLINKANSEEKLGLTKENFAKKLEKISKETEPSKNLIRFKEGLENDLATPIALSALQMASNGKGQKAGEALADIFVMEKVLSLDVLKNGFEIAEKLAKAAAETQKAYDHSGDPEAAEITALVEQRTAAKKAKDFATADKIRDELTQRGITIIDTPTGPEWKRN